MKPGLGKSTLTLLRALELAGGIATALLGLFLFWRIFAEALSLGEPVKPALDVTVFLKLALPGIVVALGSYLQVMRRKDWGAILVAIGAVSNVVFVVLNAGLAYALIQDVSARAAIFADFVVTTSTVTVACINTMMSVLFRS